MYLKINKCKGRERNEHKEITFSFFFFKLYAKKWHDWLGWIFSVVFFSLTLHKGSNIIYLVDVILNKKM